MSKELFYCDPKKNKSCSKTGCFINGGECVLTSNAEYKQNEPEPAQYNLVLNDLNWLINAATQTRQTTEVMKNERE